MKTDLSSRSFRACLSLLIAYTLLLSFSSPFLMSTRASSLVGARSGKARASLLAPLPQAPRQRSGELLIRFRAGAAQQSRDTVLATHGARRQRQLRGESGVERSMFSAARIQLLSPN